MQNQDCAGGIRAVQEPCLKGIRAVQDLEGVLGLAQLRIPPWTHLQVLLG